MLAKFYDAAQAHIVRGRLETEGIPCFLFDEQSVSVIWHMQGALGGIKLMVPRGCYEEAVEILGEISDLPPEEATATPRENPGILDWMASALVLVATGLPLPFRGKKKD